MTKVAVPGDGNGWLIDCSVAPANACEFEAKERCPDGYRVVASIRDQLTIVCRSSPPPRGALSGPQDDGGNARRIDGSAVSGTLGETTDGAPRASGSVPRSKTPGMVYDFSFGGGFIETTEKVEALPPAEGSGWGFAGNVLVARELLPGFALGGALSFHQLNGLKVDYWGTDNVVSLGFIGPDVEAFGCYTNCVRFGGAFGLAMLSAPKLSDVKNSIRRYGNSFIDEIPSDPNTISAGIGYDVHLSYELRVAPTWYAGLGFRLLGARMSNDRSIVGYSVFVDLLNY